MDKVAVLFDLDGVISNTALLHARAWKAVFDEFHDAHRTAKAGFDDSADYLRFIDGKSRLTGIIDYLHSCGITLPLGDAHAVGLDTVHGIGNAKNLLFRDLIEAGGVPIFPDALRLLERLAAAQVDIGLASSSKNARFVLEKAGLDGFFKAIMDGLVAENLGVASKPHPAFYLHASAMMGRPPKECVVLEDAISGVASAKQAGIGLVVGVSRHGEADRLQENGADLLVSSLDELQECRFWCLEPQN